MTMDSNRKDGEDGEERDRKKPGTQGEKGRAGHGANIAKQEGRPKVVDIRPNPEPKKSSGDATGDPKNATAGPSPATGSGGSRPQEGSLAPPKKPKKDRSNLRKGKWTVRTWDLHA